MPFLPKSTRFIHVITGLFFICCVSPLTAEEVKTDTDTFTLQVLGINDFHGQVPMLNKKGGMQRLTNHLLSAIDNTDEHTFVLHGGDHVGASPAESALLQDEPAIDFLNKLQSYCTEQRNSTCHILGTAGNHEFDEGSDEMKRLLGGGIHKNGPFIHSNWPGANYKTLSANVVEEASNTLLLPPYAVYDVEGVQVGIIGITLDQTPELVVPGVVDNLSFNDQAEAVAHYTKTLQKEGIQTIIVVVHDGYDGEHYSGMTQSAQFIPSESHFGRFIHRLPHAVDLVVSGHSHGFTNIYIERQNALPLLVTQAYSNGLAYADISLTIDKSSGDVVSSGAEIIYTNKPVVLSEPAKKVAADIASLIEQASNFANQYTSTIIGEYQQKEGELSLGKFLANAHLYALDADIAVMNSGGVRADLKQGKVSWGELFAIQPFGNKLMVKQYTGKQLIALLEKGHHWSDGVSKNNQGYWLVNQRLIEPTKLYRVGGNNYVMNTSPFDQGELVFTGESEIDATVNYICQLPAPFSLDDKPQ